MPLVDALLLDPYAVHKWLALRAGGIAGTGTLNDPLNANTPDRFDQLMNSFQPGTMVHLSGAGPFQTRGYSDAFSGYGWQAKARKRTPRRMPAEAHFVPTTAMIHAPSADLSNVPRWLDA